VPPFGTHLFADNGNWEWEIPVLADVDTNRIARLVARGFDAELTLGHRVELSDRFHRGLTTEVLRVIKAAKVAKLWK
jgi:hypothetical protein